jgi:hypothetical protein
MRAHANGDPNMQEVGFFFEAAQNFVYQIYSRVKNQKKNLLRRIMIQNSICIKKKNPFPASDPYPDSNPALFGTVL